ncbi:MAG: nuclear transport factor 2 family protein [Lacunisphaera sp.]
MSPLLLPRRLALLLALFSAVLLRASEADMAALRAADDERVAAILAADAARLDAIFSDDLQYTHSNGKHDTKKSYTESLVTHETVYRVYDYKERNFRLASPDIGLETAHLLITSVNGTKVNENDLNILAVWRKEGGKWRFLAWQSAKLPAPAPATK